VIQLRVRTEYSFRKAFGRIDDVLSVLLRHLSHHDERCAVITDTGTWGYVAFTKACKKHDVKPIYGVAVPVVSDCLKRERQPGGLATLLAKNSDGLQEMYVVLSMANKHGFYYYPRVSYGHINDLSEDVIVLMGHGTNTNLLDPSDDVYLAMCPTNMVWNNTVARDVRFQHTVVCDNHYPRLEDQVAYEILSQRDKLTRTTPMHLLAEDELCLAVPQAGEEEFVNIGRIAKLCNAELPRAENIKIASQLSLLQLCRDGAMKRGLTLDDVYLERMKRELDMIAEKKFEDYFFMLADLLVWAKDNMLVGPARGSSAGSLVCYLLGITEVDPLKHDLMFERFIDVTRADLPDVDIDFQDTRRDMVITYLCDKYGENRVGRIGTVSRLKSKSALGDTAKGLSIPSWEVRKVQDAVIERSTGDARAQFCVKDALETLEVGKALLEKYPAMSIAGILEGHAQHTGKHAAGVLVCQEPIVGYCTIDNSGAVQLDKKDAEALNMLKIDALGLRVLSVLQDCLDQIGKTRKWLLEYPLDDEAAFSILNTQRYSGIFQFEGYALQALCRQMKVETFDDLAVIGALARPGPLHCGAATAFIQRRIGKEPVRYMHPMLEPITAMTYGVVIYQEQVMAIGRDVGRLSWEDVSELRKAMSKSMGEEFFNKYWERFRDGAIENGIDEEESRKIWENMCTFGSWAFNKSHGISYGIISYWCCVLKAHWPLEFAAACLRHEKDEAQGVNVLRDLVQEGFAYTPVDAERSGLEWSVVDGKLIGGLTNIKGVGPKKAEDIIARRSSGRALLPGQRKLLSEAKTPYDDIFEGERRFKMIYDRPEDFNVISGKIYRVKDIEGQGDYVFLAKIADLNLRDLNEYGNVVKRGGKLIDKDPLFLNMTLEDDTGSIITRVQRWDYQQWGKPIIEHGRAGQWFMWKGSIKEDGFRLIYIKRWRCLEEVSPLYKPFATA